MVVWFWTTKGTPGHTTSLRRDVGHNYLTEGSEQDYSRTPVQPKWYGIGCKFKNFVK